VFLPPTVFAYVLVTSRAPQPPAPQSLKATLHAALAVGQVGGEGSESAGGDRDKCRLGLRREDDSLGRTRASQGGTPLEKSKQAVPPLDGRTPTATLMSEPTRNSPLAVSPIFSLGHPSEGGGVRSRGTAFW
jgi:hypothetical protein